jgi:hypothetical protein
MHNVNTLDSVMVILKNLPELLGTPVSRIGRVSQALISRSSGKGRLGNKGEQRKAAQANKGTLRPFTLEGQLMRNSIGGFSVAGEEFEIGNDTWVFGDIEPGACATVHGVLKNGVRLARKIVVTKPK